MFQSKTCLCIEICVLLFLPQNTCKCIGSDPDPLSQLNYRPSIVLRTMSLLILIQLVNLIGHGLSLVLKTTGLSVLCRSASCRSAHLLPPDLSPILCPLLPTMGNLNFLLLTRVRYYVLDTVFIFFLTISKTQLKIHA